MQDLLFLAHRIPYPPNKGDKIRSYHLLRRLAQHYRVHLGAFIDDPRDWQHTATVAAWCASTCFIGLHPLRARLASLRGLLKGEALSLPYYRNARLQRWVDKVLREMQPAVVVQFSGVMAQYLRGLDVRARSVVDFVDVDSDKWRQYSVTRPWPLSVLYARESRRLLDFERTIATRADASVFVSENEVDLFRRLLPADAPQPHGIANGVDVEYFDPSRSYDNPYPPGGPVLVFTGAMDYWANIDAAVWFASEVLPRIQERLADVRFAIVGSRPAPAVTALASRTGVIVSGTVPDMRPYLAHARLAVTPLRIARGVQNKVLEALAMGRPLLSTPQALAGITTHARPALQVADSAEGLAEAACAALSLPEDPVAGAGARDWVCAHYSWEVHLDAFERLLQPTGDAHG